MRNQKPSIPDNIFTNSMDKDIITGNLLSKISDHMPNFMIMKHTKFPKNSLNRKVRSFKKFIVNNYQEDVASIDISPVLNRDVDDIYKYYHDQLLAVINKHAPYITLTKMQIDWSKKPWIGKRIQSLIKQKEHLYSKYLSKKSKFWYNRYRSLCDMVKKCTAESKKKYFAWYFKTNINNSKKIWKGINEIIHNKHARSSEAIFLDDDGQIITDQKKVANRFNKFYTTIADKLVTKLGKPTTKFQDYLRNPNEHSIFLNETEPGEISILLSKLDVTKSGDIYGITPRLIKDAGPAMVSNLCIIFNKCLTSGTFPQLLKPAKVIPIYKADSRMLASNYRPISLLPIIGKLFEKIIFKRISSFVTKYNILFRRQYGFQNAKSTEHAVLDIQENILNSLENHRIPCCIFLDFAKAFDTVNHSILLSKLNHYGIRGQAFKLIESYLTDREQCVQLNESTSSMETIKHGVPQGSILGPLLFLLYINDISNCSKVLNFYLFADDTTIFFSHKNFAILEETINTELAHVSEWLIANKLSLNVGKSNALVFRHTRGTLPPLNIKINGLPIDEKEYAKYLGILIDNKLNFQKHIQHVNSKLSKGNAILSMVRYYLPKDVLINTYHAFIQPHIDYGLNIWGHTTKTHLTTIERQQRKALRLMNFKKKRDETTELFKQDRILPLDKNLFLQSAKLIWKASNNLLPPPLNPLFRKRPNSNSFYLPYRRLDMTHRCSSYQWIHMWNSIPKNIQSSVSINILKNNLKKHLFSQL